MYNFDKQAARIIGEGYLYGVTIIITNSGNSPKDAVMSIQGHSSSELVKKSLLRKIDTFNRHVKNDL
ncbi:MAG TPA: hypothetical protein VFK47_05125 [Ktedonobacteraceae bacterium]|nr:hypothetical protein [Ktedonobacteraceae bacterium]